MNAGQTGVIFLIGAELVAAFVLDGQPRPEISFPDKFSEMVGLAFLLYIGGFWDGD